MVRAAKAYHQSQQSGPNVGKQIDAQTPLDDFDACVAHGLPDEAGTAAANRDISLQSSTNEGSQHVTDASLVSGEFASQALQDASGQVNDTQDECSVADTDLTQLPISYGEMLILKTAAKYRQRPYDRDRQDFLARPRRPGASAHSWLMRDGAGAERVGAARGDVATASGGPSAQIHSQEPKALSSKETENLVARLTQPKRIKHHSRPPGEQIVLRSAEMHKARSPTLDVGAMIARLSTPRTARALSPTPGERIVLMWNRPERARRHDIHRMNELAQATRRGGSARAWGILPPAVTQGSQTAPKNQDNLGWERVWREEDARAAAARASEEGVKTAPKSQENRGRERVWQEEESRTAAARTPEGVHEVRASSASSSSSPMPVPPPKRLAGAPPRPRPAPGSTIKDEMHGLEGGSTSSIDALVDALEQPDDRIWQNEEIQQDDHRQQNEQRQRDQPDDQRWQDEERGYPEDRAACDIDSPQVWLQDPGVGQEQDLEEDLEDLQDLDLPGLDLPELEGPGSLQQQLPDTSQDLDLPGLDLPGLEDPRSRQQQSPDASQAPDFMGLDLPDLGSPHSSQQQVPDASQDLDLPGLELPDLEEV